MPFRHPDRSHDLGTRIEMEVRERLEEAVDHVCLDALVQARRARNLPPPAADSADDRREYKANVLVFLALLQRELTPALTPEAQHKVLGAASGADEEARLVTVQVALARTLPDYWQRFDVVRVQYLAAPPSGGEGRSLLGRLFGRG